MAKIFQKGPAFKQAEQTKKNFKGQKNLRLGSKKAPAKITVQTAERKQEIATLVADSDWFCIIDVNPEQDENLSELEFLQNKKISAVSSKKANRNDPCPCGSGKKYKKCCAA